ncbi:MAG: TlpA family protein disulfide reductase [Nitrosopumilus sp.]|nr:TlpA family protein disulfide reductase [Nitrosopumilus sp.]
MGKKVFVNLWATWCPPCRKEMPSIIKLYQSIDTSKADYIMVSLDDNFDKASNYVKTQKLIFLSIIRLKTCLLYLMFRGYLPHLYFMIRDYLFNEWRVEMILIHRFIKQC